MDINFDYVNLDIVSQLLNLLLMFAIAFVPILMGVYSKEYFDIIKKNKRKVKIGNVFAYTLVLSCVSVYPLFLIINKIGLIGSFTALFLMGALCNKVTEMVFNGTLVRIMGKFLSKSKGVMREAVQESMNEIMEDELKNIENHKRKK